MSLDSGQPRTLAGTHGPYPMLVSQPPVPLPASDAAPAATRSISLSYFALPPLLAIAFATPNPGTTAASVLSLAFIIRLLWQPGHPPVLLLLCGLQWLQGALMVINADIRGVELWTMTASRSIDDATYLTVGWSACVALGCWLATRKLTPANVASVEGLPILLNRVVAVYLGTTVLLQVVSQVAAFSLYQVIQALAGARWVFVFVIFTYGWRMPRGRLLVIAVLLFEVGVGFLAFFSNFKLPLYLFAVSLATSGYRITMRAWLALLVVFAFTLYLGVLWSAIKMDYRDKLSGGMGHRNQVIVIGVEERVDSFVDLVGTVDSRLLEQGFEKLVSRVAYVEFFSYVIDYVPAVRDHENGLIWGRALAHVFVPRVFFPDKAPLPDDTEVTEHYTGLNLGAGNGTSISIGLPAETYVDFGRPGVFAFGLLCGVMFGLGYRYFVTQKKYGVFAQGMAVSLCVLFGSTEMGAAKTIGGYLSLLIVSVLLWRFVLPRLVPWLQGVPIISERKF